MYMKGKALKCVDRRNQDYGSGRCWVDLNAVMKL